MVDRAERESQSPLSEVQLSDRFPSAEEIRQREVERVIESVVRTRSVILPLVVVLLLPLVLLEPSPERIFALGLMTALAVSVTTFDRLRLRGGGRPSASQIPFDLLIGAVAQTVVIFTTGMIESPFIVAFVVLALLTGVALGRSRGSLLVMAGVTLALWAIALAETRADYFARWPGFFPPEGAVAGDTARVITKAAITNAILIVAHFVGLRVHKTIVKMIDEALHVRQQLVGALRDRNRELVGIAGGIAHELKNPLASIQGLVQLLQRSDENKERRFEVLNREVARMKDVLEAFLNFSRPLGELTIGEVHLEELFAELATLHEGLLSAHGITLDTELEWRGTLSCDRRKISQALTNLLQNAIEALPPGGRIVCISRIDGETIALGVKDDGPGLEPAMRDKAGQVVGSTTKKGGSGIGLAVSRAIAEQHGGRLVLAHPSTGGLEARIELPAPVIAPAATGPAPAPPGPPERRGWSSTR